MSHPDRKRVGKEVLVGGPVNLDGMLLVVPSLEVIRDGSLPLTLEDQITTFRSSRKG